VPESYKTIALCDSPAQTPPSYSLPQNIEHRTSPAPSTTRTSLYSMPTLAAHVPPITQPSKHYGTDLELDDQWKRQPKESTEETFKSGIEGARASQQAQLIQGRVVSRTQLDWQYQQAMNNIKGLMEEHHRLGLTEEMDERHRNASIPSISSTFGHSPPKNANAAPIQNPELRRSSTGRRDNPHFLPSNKYQIGPHGSVASIHSTRSGHSGKGIRQLIAETISEWADDVEESSSPSTVKKRLCKTTPEKSPWDMDSKRGSRGDSRPILVDASVMNGYDHDSPPSLRSASGPGSMMMQYATSSSSSFVEDWFHVPMEPADKPARDKRSKRGRRRDTRPILVDANIMDRYDHDPPPSLRSAPDPSSTMMQHPTFAKDRFHAAMEPADKPPRDKDSKRGSRRDNRPTPVDASIMNRYNHEPPPTSLRSALGPSSKMMQYATPASLSFVGDRFHHPVERERERPRKSSRTYLDSEPPYVSLYDPPDMSPSSAHPGPGPPPRSLPYGGAGIEMDFVRPYAPFGPSVSPASPFGGDQDDLGVGGEDRDGESLIERDEDRDYYHPPISHEASFGDYDRRIRELDWELDREHDRKLYESRRHRERESDRRRRERDWEMDRERDRNLHKSQRYREREFLHSNSTPQEKVEAEIELLKIPSQEEMGPTWQSWHTPATHHPLRPKKKTEASSTSISLSLGSTRAVDADYRFAPPPPQEKSRAQRHHQQVFPTYAPYALPVSMPMPQILQTPVVPENPLSQCVPSIMDTFDCLRCLFRNLKEREIHPLSVECLATKLVNNSLDSLRTSVIPRECVPGFHSSFSS